MRDFRFAIAALITLFGSSAESQTFKTLVQFSGSGGAAVGANPFGSLTLDGTTLFGLTYNGGTNGFGNLFSVGMDGTNYRNLVFFTGSGGTAPGSHPPASLTLSGTTLFGMTRGGNTGIGNIFSVGAGGTNYGSLVSFTGTGGVASGSDPFGNLTLSGTTLYGMTGYGGAGGLGNVFSVGTGGTGYENLISFTGTGGMATGANPAGSLTLSDTTLYGMTAVGGSQGDGNLFSVGTDGSSYHNLLSFTGTAGAAPGWLPNGSLTLGGTTLYGMTAYGGANNDGAVFSIGAGGTDFHSLLSFTGSSGAASGAQPYGSLILSGTMLYGMTSAGGIHGAGNIFSMGIDGSGYQDLYDLTGGSGGSEPYADLTLSGGTLFGMTVAGGANLNSGGNGTIFALTLPTPEPGTLVLVCAAAVALASYRWRRLR